MTSKMMLKLFSILKVPSLKLSCYNSSYFSSSEFIFLISQKLYPQESLLYFSKLAKGIKTLNVGFVHNSKNMIKSLTKLEYYREKKIPLVNLCRRLQPEQPVRNHLIESLPRLGTEFEKIKLQLNIDNKTTLELANAHKIIHELEYQLEIMTAKCTQYEDQLFECRNQNKQLERQVVRLEERATSLENTIQRNEFGYKAKFESEKQYHYSIIGQYERRIEEMNQSYEKLKSELEKELQSFHKFHQNSMLKAEMQMKELENTAQTDISNFKKEIEKVFKQNSLLRQKITDLQTCSQEHLCELQKANSSLTQTNMNMKFDYQYKLMTLQTELDLSRNKIKELYDEIAEQDNRFSKQSNLWREEKINLDRKYVENDENWKNNYNQALKQKDKAIQEINRKSIELSQKQKEIINLNDKIKRMERNYSELVQENLRIIEQSERNKRQAIDNLKLDYQNRISDLCLQHERKLKEQTSRAVQNEKRVLQQKHKSQIQKYIESIHTLQDQKLTHWNQLRLAQQEKRKFQSVIEQMKVEIEYLNRTNKQAAESLKSQIDNLIIEYEHKITIKHNEYLTELDRIKVDHGLSYGQLKQKYEIKIKQLEQSYDNKNWEMKELEGKNQKLEDQYEQEKAFFLGKIQSLEETIQKVRSNNENLVKENKFLFEKLEILETDIKKYEYQLNEQSKIRVQLEQNLNLQTENINRLKNELHQSEFKHIQIVKDLQFDLFEVRRRQSTLSIQLASLEKKLSDLNMKFVNAQSDIKKLQCDKIELQRKISEKDVSSQQRWQIIQAEFSQLHKKLAQQTERLQKQLKDSMVQRQMVILNSDKRIQELESILIRERNETEIMNINWQAKCKELEQANRKLIKSSIILQDIEKENNQKASNLKHLQKDIQQCLREIQNKDKEVNILKTKLTESESQLNCLRSESLLKDNEINRLKIISTQISREYEMFKEQIEREYQEMSKEKSTKDQQICRWQCQLELIARKLGQEQDKYLQVVEENKNMSQKICQMQAEFDLEAKKVRDDKVKALQQIQILENQSEQLKQIIAELSIKFEQYRNEQQQIISLKDNEIMNLQIRSNAFENDFLQVKEQLQSLKQRLDTEKQTSHELKIKLDRTQFEKQDMSRKIQTLIEEIERLERIIQKHEQDIMKIYEETEIRIDLARSEVKIYYEKELELKNSEIEEIKKKMKYFVDQQRQQTKKRQTKLNEDKQKLYKEIYEKSSRITEIEIQYDGLEKVYEQIFNELQMYKRKWNKMFEEFHDTNEELTEINFKLNEYKTEEKRNRIVKEFYEVKTERTEKIIPFGNQKQTPANQNSTSKGQESTGQHYKNVSGYTQHSQAQSSIKVNTKVITSLLSNSNVVDSRHMGGNPSSSDMSVRLDCSSVSSKFSMDHE